MKDADPTLIATAQGLATEVGDLLHRTVVDDPPVGAQVAGGRVVVSAFDGDGNTVDMPLTIDGVHRLDLRISFRCRFDVTGAFLGDRPSQKFASSKGRTVMVHRRSWRERSAPSRDGMAARSATWWAAEDARGA